VTDKFESASTAATSAETSPQAEAQAGNRSRGVPVVALADLGSHTLAARDRLQQAGGVGGAAGDRAAGAERIERGTITVMSMETFLVVVFLGGSLWAWAKWEREKQEGRRRRDEEDRIIAEHQRGLTNEEIAKMLGVGTERVRELVDYNDVRVRELVDYWRFVNDEPLMTPPQIAEAQKLAREWKPK